MKYKGFTLVEFIVYLTLTIFLLYWLIPWSVSIINLGNKIQLKINNAIDCNNAHDLFFRDILRSSSEYSTWLMMLPHHILWREKDGTHKEWLYKKNSIYRSVGVYDPLKGLWLKKHTDLVIPHITVAFFTITQCQKYIQTIRLDITVDDQHYFFTGAARYAYS